MTAERDILDSNIGHILEPFRWFRDDSNFLNEAARQLFQRME